LLGFLSIYRCDIFPPTRSSCVRWLGLIPDPTHLSYVMEGFPAHPHFFLVRFLSFRFGPSLVNYLTVSGSPFQPSSLPQHSIPSTPLKLAPRPRGLSFFTPPGLCARRTVSYFAFPPGEIEAAIGAWTVFSGNRLYLSAYFSPRCFASPPLRALFCVVVLSASNPLFSPAGSRFSFGPCGVEGDSFILVRTFSGYMNPRTLGYAST